ncbi:MAG: type IVB secretion system protein IcmD/DotP [Gammaproteobacteria bacterium]
MTKQKFMGIVKKSTGFLACLLLVGVASAGFATISGVAQNVTSTLGSVARLITAISYIAGLGFAVGAILKFKAHKDNPTQIPIGTPFALLFVAGALLFLPTILGVTGATLFRGQAQTGGPSGYIFESQGGGA